MDPNRIKRASEWFYTTQFREEPIRPQARPGRQSLPSQLRAARALQNDSWQPRDLVFLKQAKLLAQYEDDFPDSHPVTCYYPTYQSLTDNELRAYFGWRTALRRGEIRKTSLSFAFLYIYELLGQIGVEDPMDGYRKLRQFQQGYGQLDGGVEPYLSQWLVDYVVYYQLPPSLLAEEPWAVFDRSIAVVTRLQDHNDGALMDAVRHLAPRWISRSKFCNAHDEDFSAVLCRVLRKMSDHYAARCKRTLAEQFFGKLQEYPVRLFASAVFRDGSRGRNCDYRVDEVKAYRCRNGFWTVWQYSDARMPCKKLEELVKTVDSIMRQCFGFRAPVKPAMDTKWVLRLIREETGAYLEEKKAAQAPRLNIDFGSLNAIRRDAAITRDRLIVEEEAEEIPAPIPEPPAQEMPDIPLSPREYRLLQCLLYERPLDWVRQEGLMLTVLADGINEKLYDRFADTVLDDTPELIPDYTEELKEIVLP